jgi:hypothetical protein
MKLSLNPNAPDRRLLDESRRTRAMTWIMAIMLFLTVLAGALGLGMFAATAQLDRQLAGRLTIQIVEPNARGAGRRGGDIRAASQGAGRGARAGSRPAPGWLSCSSPGSAIPGSIPICRCRQ